MPDIHGNIEGIRKSVLDEMKTLYDLQLEPDVFLPQEVLSALCGWSASFNREVALYVLSLIHISSPRRKGRR